MRILLTGATGFLGRHLALGFERAGHDVTIIARPSSSPTKLRILEKAGITCAILDWANRDAIDALFDNGRFDAVVHAAAIYGRHKETHTQLVSTNLTFGLSLIEAAVQFRVPLFLNTDSSLPRDFNAYTLSKAQMTDWAQLTCSNTPLRFVNIRLEHLYGPDDDESKFPEYVIAACLRNQPTLKLSLGDAVRDFVHVDDVVSAYLALLNSYAQSCETESENHELRHAEGSYFNIPVGSGKGYSIKHFVKLVHELSDSTTELQFGALPYRRNEVMSSIADLSEMHKYGWVPKITLEAGLQRIMEMRK